MSTNFFPAKSKSNQKKSQIEILQELEQTNSSNVQFEQIFGASSEKSQTPASGEKSPARGQEFKTVFSKEEHQIPELMIEIRTEIEALKRANSSVVSEAEEIEKTTFSMEAVDAGIYHVNFLHTILSLIRNLRTKVGEARTWMAALHSKKAKRGSLFMVRSKKKGVEYSMSPELQNSRSVM